MVPEEYLGEQKAGNGFLTRISSPPRDACNSGPREGFPSHNQLPRRALNKDQKRKLHNNPKGFHGLQGSYRDDDKRDRMRAGLLQGLFIVLYAGRQFLIALNARFH